MARRGSSEVGFLLVDGYDILGVSTSLTDNLEAHIQEGHGFGESWVRQLPTGTKQAEITQEGFYDDASLSSNDALVGKEGVNRLLCYGLEGNTIGRNFVAYSGAMQANCTRIATRGELHRANSSYQGNGIVEDGKILHPHVAETGAGDTTGSAVDHGASTVEGGTAYLQVSALALGGHDGALVKILHSDDGEIWDELVAFTALTAAPGKARNVAAGEVKRYLAASWEFTGAGESPQIKFFAGFRRR